MASSLTPKSIEASLDIADAASWCCSIILLLLILSGSFTGNNNHDNNSLEADEPAVRGNRLLNRPCDEIYVVGEGETLHTISDKCGDPFIVERNPHIHDPDDVFPGLVIKVIPSFKA